MEILKKKLLLNIRKVEKLPIIPEISCINIHGSDPITSPTTAFLIETVLGSLLLYFRILLYVCIKLEWGNTILLGAQSHDLYNIKPNLYFKMSI